MDLNELEYVPKFLDIVNYASLHEMEKHGVEFLGRYVFTPDRPPDSPSQTPLNVAKKSGNFLSRGLNAVFDKVRRKPSTLPIKSSKPNHQLTNFNQCIPSFIGPKTDLTEGQRTLFHLYRHDKISYAVFAPTANPKFPKINCMSLDFALSLFYAEFELNDAGYKPPDKLLIPVSWQDPTDEDNKNIWSLICVTPIYDGKGNINKAETDIEIYGYRDMELHRKAMRLMLKTYTKKKIPQEDGKRALNAPLYSDDFDLENATKTHDGGPWVNKNIRSIILGTTPHSTDKLDTNNQYGYYYRWLKFEKTAYFFEQIPPTLWERYRTTILLIGTILLLGAIAGAFACAFPLAFSSLIYGCAALVGISNAAIGTLSLAQIALTSAALVATFSAVLVTIGMLIKAGITHITTRNTRAKEKDYSLLDISHCDDGEYEAQNTKSTLPSVKETLEGLPQPVIAKSPTPPVTSKNPIPLTSVKKKLAFE